MMSLQAWQTYWQRHPTANSFLYNYESADGPYRVISDYWAKKFAKFVVNDHVLDVGAGNGALSHLYLNQFPKPLITKWHNIDLANIEFNVPHACVEHIQGDMHSLPLLDTSINQALSMFGIEYGDLNKSMLEVSRVLVPDGQFHCLLHHPDSIISRQSQITVNISEKILRIDFISNPESLLDLSYEEIKKHCLKRLNMCLHSVDRNLQDDVKLVGKNVYKILHVNSSVDVICNCFQQLNNEITAQLIRLTNQLDAANQVKAFFDTDCQKKIIFKNQSVKLLKFNNNIIGYTFSGVK